MSTILRDTTKLPKWAQRHITELQQRVKAAEATIPWTEPGMEWYTLFAPIGNYKRPPRRLFTCSEAGTHCVCAIGEGDFVFVGRGNKPQGGQGEKMKNNKTTEAGKEKDNE